MNNVPPMTSNMIENMARFKVLLAITSSFEKTTKKLGRILRKNFRSPEWINSHQLHKTKVNPKLIMSTLIRRFISYKVGTSK